MGRRASLRSLTVLWVETPSRDVYWPHTPGLAETVDLLDDDRDMLARLDRHAGPEAGPELDRLRGEYQRRVEQLLAWLAALLAQQTGPEPVTLPARQSHVVEPGPVVPLDTRLPVFASAP